MLKKISLFVFLVITLSACSLKLGSGREKPRVLSPEEIEATKLATSSAFPSPRPTEALATPTPETKTETNIESESKSEVVDQ